jgi:hypothetical protein
MNSNRSNLLGAAAQNTSMQIESRCQSARIIAAYDTANLPQ